MNLPWKEFIENVPWFLANGQTAEVGDFSPPGSWAPASPEFGHLFPELDRLLRTAIVTPIFVAEAEYRLFSWLAGDSTFSSWLSPLASVDPPSSLFEGHRVLLKSFGGIVERSNEPDWWIRNHNDALTESVARSHKSFLKKFGSLFEEAPINAEQFYVIAEEANFNLTLCHHLSGEIVLFAPDHNFDYVKPLPGSSKNTLYGLPMARYFCDWVKACALQWRGSIGTGHL